MRILSDGYSEEFPSHANGNAKERERKLIIAIYFVLFIETKLIKSFL